MSDWQRLQALAPQLAGKRIVISESGYSGKGIVDRVEVSDSQCIVYYREADAGDALLTQSFTRGWGGYYLTESDISISIPMIGKSTIYL